MKGKKYVLDTSALMTFFEDEDDADIVENLLQDAEIGNLNIYVSFISFTELYYISIQEQGLELAQKRIEDLSSMPINRVESNSNLSLIAGELKAKNRISLADAYIAALAKERKAVLVHKDPEFEALHEQIEVLKLKYK